MALPLIPIAVTALRSGAARLLISSRGQTGLLKSGLQLAGQAMSKLAKANPLTQLFVGVTGLQAAGSVVKGSQLNAEVRRHAPTGSGW